jgi:hypothetical protein
MFISERRSKSFDFSFVLYYLALDGYHVPTICQPFLFEFLLEFLQFDKYFRVNSIKKTIDMLRFPYFPVDLLLLFVPHDGEFECFDAADKVVKIATDGVLGLRLYKGLQNVN